MLEKNIEIYKIESAAECDTRVRAATEFNMKEAAAEFDKIERPTECDMIQTAV